LLNELGELKVTDRTHTVLEATEALGKRMDDANLLRVKKLVPSDAFMMQCTAQVFAKSMSEIELDRNVKMLQKRPKEYLYKLVQTGPAAAAAQAVSKSQSALLRQHGHTVVIA
jgi:hypothetical protein